MTIAGSSYLNRPLRTVEQAEADRWHRRRRCYRCGYPLTYLDSLCCVCRWKVDGRPPPQNSWPMSNRFPADANAHGIYGDHRLDEYETDYD